MVTEINAEASKVRLVVYRLTVPNITTALLNKLAANIPVQIAIEPNEYQNRKWPEFWLTRANIDRLWAAGAAVKQRLHAGLTHAKLLITSNYATNASSNYAAAWQRDTDYFVSSSAKPTIYQAMVGYFDNSIWNDTTAFTNFVPQPADTPTLASPANLATGLSTTPTLTWNIATFATSYDVYIGTSTSNMVLAGNVPAQLVNNPPSTYSFKPSTALQGGTTYFWKVVSRTFACDVQPSLLRPSTVRSFTTTGTAGGTPPPPPPSSLPSPWSNQDVGSTGLAGSASFSNGVFTVNGAGADIWGNADAFQYVFQTWSGDAQIVARVTSEQNTSSLAKAGVMIRETTAAGSTHAILDINPTGNVEFLARASTGGTTSWIPPGATHAFPAWLRLVRTGSTITSSVSSDGANWTTVGTTTVSMGSAITVGLAVCSHTTTAIDTSTFDSVSVSLPSTSPPPPPPPPPLPSPWLNQDVGTAATIGIAGSASASNGVFTVKGAGADIWGATDGFQYVYQSLPGDGQIVARVTSEQNTSSLAKAGVMLRTSTNAGSAHVILDMKPTGEAEFMVRATTGGTTTWIPPGATQGFPAWLKLQRIGSTVTAFISADGITWTTVGTTTVSLGTTITVGMVVCSHTTSALNTSTFDNVTVGPPQ
jgi:regulation of enolase protein 1 (concanavalin A-like superfamily)